MLKLIFQNQKKKKKKTPIKKNTAWKHLKSVADSWIIATQMKYRILMHLKCQALYLNFAKMPFYKVENTWSWEKWVLIIAQMKK